MAEYSGGKRRANCSSEVSRLCDHIPRSQVTMQSVCACMCVRKADRRDNVSLNHFRHSSVELSRTQLETCPERTEMRKRNERDRRGIRPWEQWEFLGIFQKDSEKKCQDSIILASSVKRDGKEKRALRDLGQNTVTEAKSGRLLRRGY